MHARNLLPTLMFAAVAVSAGCGNRQGAAGPGDAVIGRATASAVAAPAVALPLRIAPDLTVRAVRFGLLKSDAGSDDEFVATNEIPAVDGQAFGWIIEVDTTRRTLHWQEHLRMPAPPADWGDAASDPDLVISKDGMSAVAQGEDEVDDHELSRFYWSLATGDPGGEYELDVAVEGHAVAHIRFRVPATVSEPTIFVHHAPTAGGVHFQRARTRGILPVDGTRTPWT